MLRFTHDDFELDLTHLNVTFNWKNIWFSQEVASEFSFPFSMPKNVWSKIANLGSYNSLIGANVYEGKLYKDGQLVPAQLKLQNKKGDLVNAIIYVGYEGIPFLEKKLPDLPLMKFPVANLKADALSVLPQGYPDVNYNFPSVHTDKYDKKSSEYAAFICINFMSAGAFIDNYIDEDNVDQIRNIMQPLPYLMYVLKTAIESDGYVLQGDILNIEDLKKALIFRDGNYFNSSKLDVIPFHVASNEWDTALPTQHGYEKVFYNKQITVTKKGSYELSGNIRVLVYRWFAAFAGGGAGVFGYRTTVRVKLFLHRAGVDTLIGTFQFLETTPGTGVSITSVYPQIIKADVTIPLDLEIGDIIRLESEEARRDIEPSPTPDYPEMSSLDLLALRYKEADGTPIVFSEDLEEIDLARCVPDMTVSDCINAVRKAKNLGFEVEGNVVTMNFIKLDRATATDASIYDIEEPLETYNDERSYELSYQDGKSNESHKYDSVFVDRSGVKINDYKTNKNTTQVTIDLLPLPKLTRDSITTAYSYEDETSKLRLVFYDHTAIQDYPATYENVLFKMENLYLNYYQYWLDFLLKSVSYEWNFIISVEQLHEITKSSIIYAYKNYHVFSEMEKERLDKMYYSVTAKSESLY